MNLTLILYIMSYWDEKLLRPITYNAGRLMREDTVSHHRMDLKRVHYDIEIVSCTLWATGWNVVRWMGEVIVSHHGMDLKSVHYEKENRWLVFKLDLNLINPTCSWRGVKRGCVISAVCQAPNRRHIFCRMIASVTEKHNPKRSWFRCRERNEQVILLFSPLTTIVMHRKFSDS